MENNPYPEYESARNFLYDRIDYERALSIPYQSRSFKLDRMCRLLALLNYPQRSLNIIHVAGTKGKGSTSSLIASVLTAAGYRCGLYTSPHLDRLEERMAIDGVPCSESEFVSLIDHLRPVIIELDREFGSRGGPTYFEITTALALMHFRLQAVDIAVLEVGLGGRLDSTNICSPLVSVITSISFDHTAQLGETLAEIAAEKAGIIKRGIPVVSGVTQEEPRAVVKKLCQECGSPLQQIGTDFDFEYTPQHSTAEDPMPAGRMTYWEPSNGYRLEDLGVGLWGRHQAANAAVAIATLQQLTKGRWQIPEQSLRFGIRNAVCPARIELLAGRPAVIIDSAHNVASVEALVQTVLDYMPSKRRCLIFATSRDKDAAGMLESLLPWFETVLFTRFRNNPRAADPDDLASTAARIVDCRGAIAEDSGQLLVRPDAVTAWDTATQMVEPNGLICVTGSFFVAAEVRSVALRSGIWQTYGVNQQDCHHSNISSIHQSAQTPSSSDSALNNRDSFEP